MTDRPGIPALVIIPDGSKPDFSAIYGIATAYADAGTLVSSYGNSADRPEMAFPAIVCSSFAIELFLKFFLAVQVSENVLDPKLLRGHDIIPLWEKISPPSQELIVAMFRNNSGKPSASGLEARKKLFLEAFEGIGSAPFVNWRYVHELEDPILMSQESINEVLDALGRAASYLISERTKVGNAV